MSSELNDRELLREPISMFGDISPDGLDTNDGAAGPAAVSPDATSPTTSPEPHDISPVMFDTDETPPMFEVDATGGGDMGYRMDGKYGKVTRIPEKTLAAVPEVKHEALAPVVVVSECKFGNDSDVCSKPEYIAAMQELLADSGEHAPTDPLEIVKAVKQKFECETESCVYTKPEFLKYLPQTIKEELDEMFKPRGPGTNFGLLSNFNIDHVLDQFQDTFEGFLHIPFQMRDFETVGTELAKIDLAKKFATGTRTFGVVLNTDYSYGNGIHWFCLFGVYDGKSVTLEYFNSSGRKPLPEVQVWLGKTAEYLRNKMKIPVQIVQSANRSLQNDNHSCGVWSLFYIWARLLGVEHTWFTPENVNDKFMHWLRQNLFRSH